MMLNDFFSLNHCLVLDKKMGCDRLFCKLYFVFHVSHEYFSLVEPMLGWSCKSG
jgi:hypothetical protein